MAKSKPTLNEADLKLLEEKFLTKEDGKNFATKNYVTNAVDEAKEEILEEQRKFRSEFFDRIDPILKEVVANREERTIMAHYITELRKRVEKIEKRLGLTSSS